jgi:hypothetical protein
MPYWQLFFSLITPQRNCCKEKILGDEHFSIAHKILERFFSANPLTNLKNIFRKTPTAITLQFVPTNTDADIRGDPHNGPEHGELKVARSLGPAPRDCER